MKIVQVINAMVTNQANIGNVIANGTEYFFKYKNKYKWSISKNGEEYVLFFYPTSEMTLDQLAHFEDWEAHPYVPFKSEDIKTREAKESFAELYNVVASKLFGLDEVFDDIIGG